MRNSNSEHRQRARRVRAAAVLLACSLFPGAAGATAEQGDAPAALDPDVSAANAALGVADDGTTVPAPAGAHGRARAPRQVSSFVQTQKTSERQRLLYSAQWGIDQLKVSQTASGNLIRFTWLVTDAARARPLADKALTPYLQDQRTGAVLHIPVMDKVGALRQAGQVVAGKEYWMTFSNKGNLVKAGERVNVVIGGFHADGLVVE